MKKFSILISLAFFIIAYCSVANAQFESILDSTFKKHFIGFSVEVEANQLTTIFIADKDSNNVYVLYDSILDKSQKIIFLFPKTYVYENEYYSDYIVIKISNDITTGVYNLYFLTRKKFVLIR